MRGATISVAHGRSLTSPSSRSGRASWAATRGLNGRLLHRSTSNSQGANSQGANSQGANSQGLNSQGPNHQGPNSQELNLKNLGVDPWKLEVGNWELTFFAPYNPPP